MINPTPYLRARVLLHLDKPLIRVVISLREKNYLVQYEKLPFFCDFSALMGHEKTECGNRVHEISKCQWGEWLLVKFGGNNNGRRGDGGRGCLPARGRGRGRGVAGEAAEGDDMNIYDYMRMILARTIF